jgi:uncharacterized protein YcbX
MPAVASLSRVSALTLDARGPVGDRRFMVVDEQGGFLTQRDLPAMTLIRADLAESGVVLSHPDKKSISAGPAGSARMVEVWGDVLPAEDCGDDAAIWLSDLLARSCRLVRFADHAMRRVNPKYSPEGGEVAFADAYPLLIVSQAALDELNARLERPIGIERFRPNVVIDGSAAHAEDEWERIEIGGVTLDLVKPCDRCTIPGKEPLTTLATYRRSEGKVYFGQNAVHRGLGTLRAGDAVRVVRSR